MIKVNIKRLSTAAFCVYLVAVAVLCFLKPSSLPEVRFTTIFGIPVDKLVHFLMFLPYPILSGLSFMNRKLPIFVNMFILAILVTTGAGIAYGTEVLQAQTGYRSYEIADFNADLAGIAVGAVCTFIGMLYIKLNK